MKISAVINTLNEETNIADCIRSVQGLADEIVVCDMRSHDRTAEIAQTLGARVVRCERVQGSWTGEPRRYAIQEANGPWILMIDADERLTPELAEQLRRVVKEDKYDCVKFRKLTLYFGGYPRYGIFFTSQPLLFRQRVYLENYTGGEAQLHRDWAGVSDLERTLVLPPEYYYIHLAYPTIEKYVSKTLGMYARLEAEQIHGLGGKFSFLRLIGEPVKIFAQSFLLCQGYRDGMRGFILAVLYAGFRFTTWANVWLLEELAKQKGLSKR